MLDEPDSLFDDAFQVVSNCAPRTLPNRAHDQTDIARPYGVGTQRSSVEPGCGARAAGAKKSPRTKGE